MQSAHVVKINGNYNKEGLIRSNFYNKTPNKLTLDLVNVCDTFGKTVKIKNLTKENWAQTQELGTKKQ